MTPSTHIALAVLLLSSLLGCKDKNPEPSPPHAAIPSRPQPTPAPPPIPHKCPNTLDSDSRQKLALILQNIYKAEGNPITVIVAEENCDILQLSGMLAEGNHMMEAAERETIYCADCMLVYKKAKFKAIHFLGPDLNVEYLVE